MVCMHIGSSSLLMTLPPEAPLLLLPVLQFANSYASMADFVFSGVLDRFPDLKLAYSEGQAGWIPYAMERMDHAYAHHTWALGDEKLKEKPSTYVRRNMWGCIFADKHAIANAEHIGVDNLMFEVDFPHSDGPFPHTRSHLVDQFAGGVDPPSPTGSCGGATPSGSTSCPSTSTSTPTAGHWTRCDHDGQAGPAPVTAHGALLGSVPGGPAARPAVRQVRGGPRVHPAGVLPRVPRRCTDLGGVCGRRTCGDVHGHLAPADTGLRRAVRRRGRPARGGLRDGHQHRRHPTRRGHDRCARAGALHPGDRRDHPACFELA